uniref:Toll-like receptor 22 n=1 Tax=Myripristis murdjan TaxID=586833 RepID=A0A668AAC0_9TELE
TLIFMTVVSDPQNLCIFISLFCLLSITGFAVPVTAYTLKRCRISRNKAICTESHLTNIPQDIPARVIGFDLSKNRISKIKVSDFKDLKNLKTLYLIKNNISVIDKGAFTHLIALQVLNLNTNSLTEVEDNLFDGLSNLTELRLAKNHIQAVAPSAFQSLTNLNFLDLGNNKLHSLTQVKSILHYLPHLQYLWIGGNNFSTFQSSDFSSKSTKLRELDLSGNSNLKVFNLTTDIFPNLTSLNLGHCGKTNSMIWEVHNKTFLGRVSNLDISGLNMSLEGMKTLLESLNSSLISLRMSAMRRNVQALINISCGIPSLSKLELRSNGFKAVTQNLFHLCVSVSELDLASNQIRCRSDNCFRSLRQLRILNLKSNRLSSVPFATRNLPTLEELDLSFNEISALGCQDFANLTTLRKLSIRQNMISSLKDCAFKDLRQLQVLRLNNNYISNLNGAFKNYLPNLISLTLNKNRLTIIRKGTFASLQSLQNLSLHENQINRLEPGSFIGLTNLTIIQLQSNNLTRSQINISVFGALKNLKTLHLMENHIKYDTEDKIVDPPFSQLSKLETLLIFAQHYRLKSHLPQNLLQGLTNLLVFRTRNIEILSLHPDTFNYTPLLKELDISSNELTDIPAQLFSQIKNLEKLYVSRTNLRSLDFLVNANLTKLRFLQVRKNAFSVISEEQLQSLPALDYLDMQGNSFTCNCDNAWFLQWVKNNNQTQVYDAYNFECNYPHALKGMKLLNIDFHTCSVDIGFICFMSTSCTVILFLLAFFTYHFLRWQLVYAYYLLLASLFDKKQRNKQTSHQYDAFVSYNIHDEPWVLRELLPKLEGEQGWRLCLHHRDFQPGKPILDNITDAIYQSRKTLCVISRRYLESEWCSREIQVASFRLFDERKDVLILVFLEEIPGWQLTPYHRIRRLLRRRTYLSWSRAEEHRGLFWEKLRQALETKEDPVLQSKSRRHQRDHGIFAES